MRALNLSRLQLDVVEAGLDKRLGWLIDNTLDAVRKELSASPPRTWALTCQRAELVLETFRESTWADRPGPFASDILDPDIRTRKTLDEVRAALSPISQHWGIITSLQPEDFARALSRSRHYA